MQKDLKIELNITMRCNQACPSCNKLCNIYRDRTEDMSLEQIQKFIKQVKDNNINVIKLKLLGGEPFLHPDYINIYNFLFNELKTDGIRFLKIDTNKTLKNPIKNIESHPGLRMSGRKFVRKHHFPILKSPLDLNLPIKFPCSMPMMCGISLDKYGYLPCSGSLGIVRLLKLNHLYRLDLKDCMEPWGLSEICPNCIFAAPKSYTDKYCTLRLDHHTKEDKEPTETYKKAIEEYNLEEFYQNQKEF